jgi:hypothetical protein
MLILTIINLAEINIRIFLDELKYIFIATIILFGYLIIYLNTLPIVMKKIVIFFKYFIIIEIIVCIDQLFLFNSFSFLYEYERSRSIESVLRAVGTLSNPNFFGLIMSQVIIIISLFDPSKIKFFWIIIAFILLLISSSKSIILTSIFLFTFSYWMINGSRIFSKNTLLVVLYVILFFIFLKVFLNQFGSIFKNMSVILNIIDNGFSSLHTVSARYEIWDTATSYYLANLNSLELIFGYGGINEFSVLDNSYIMIFYRYGIIGLILYILLYYHVFKLFIKQKNIKIKIFSLQMIIMFLILAIQSDLLLHWFYPSIMYLFIGINIKLNERNYIKKYINTNCE